MVMLMHLVQEIFHMLNTIWFANWSADHNTVCKFDGRYTVIRALGFTTSINQIYSDLTTTILSSSLIYINDGRYVLCLENVVLIHKKHARLTCVRGSNYNNILWQFFWWPTVDDACTLNVIVLVAARRTYSSHFKIKININYKFCFELF